MRNSKKKECYEAALWSKLAMNDLAHASAMLEMNQCAISIPA